MKTATSKKQNATVVRPSDMEALDLSMADINKQLKKLQEGQLTTNNAIQGISDQMLTLQTITNSLKNHDQRIKKVEDKATLMHAQIQQLTKRLNQVEHKSFPSTIQINGIPTQPNEDLNKVVLDIGKVIELDEKTFAVKSTTRLKSRNNPLRTSTSIQSDSNNVSTEEQALIEVKRPDTILANFTTIGGMNNFLGAFRKKKAVFIDDIGMRSVNSEDKQKIFIYENNSQFKKIVHSIKTLSES